MKNNTHVLINHRNNKKLLGRVKAFDRHCNMVLEGVKEMWTTALKTGKDKKKTKPVLGKIFLRGDSVILVVKIEGQMFPLANRYPDSDHKKPEILLPQVRSHEEMGGGMMTEPKGYCAKYIAMGSEDTHVISRDHCHHDPADWLEE